MEKKMNPTQPHTLEAVTEQLRKIRTKRFQAEAEISEARNAWLALEKDALVGDTEVDPRARAKAQERLETAKMQVEGAAMAEADLRRDLEEAAKAEFSRLDDGIRDARSRYLAALDRDVSEIERRLIDVLVETLQSLGGQLSEKGFAFPTHAVTGRPVFPADFIQKIWMFAAVPAQGSARAAQEEEQRLSTERTGYNPSNTVSMILRKLDVCQEEPVDSLGFRQAEAARDLSRNSRGELRR